MFRCCCNCNRYKRNYREIDNYDITMNQLLQMQLDGALVVDIRSPQEYNEGHIKGAIVLPDYEIRRMASNVIPNKNETIIVYCGTGIRSKNAQKCLQRLGYVNVYNLYKGTENY